MESYNRQEALKYAHRWAYIRNPRYYDFDKIGGDCTNFTSQVLYAGSGIMNYTPTHGWYYKNQGQRAPSWTGVGFLYDFLIKNKGEGPFAEEVDIKDVREGDIIQLSFQGGGTYQHSLVVVEAEDTKSMEKILIATHTYDRDNYPLSKYTFIKARYLHILGVRGK